MVEPAPVHHLQRMLAGISDSFSVYDHDWNIVFTNRAVIDGKSVDVSEVVGRNIWTLVPEAVGTVFHRELVRVMDEGTPTTFEEFFEPTGRWYEVHAYPVADVGIAAYSRDVTARHGERALLERLARFGEVRAEVGEALSRQQDLRSMLQHACEAIVAKLRMSFCRAWLVDAAGEVLELQASAGKYTHIDGGHARVPVGALKIGRIASERRPYLSNDILHDERLGDRAWAQREGMVAFAGYPMIVGDRLIGVLAAFATERLPEDTLIALGSLADAIAQGIERRRAELTLSQHVEELARSNADLEHFAYVASHDLQEPLRMVGSYVQLLERRYGDKLDSDAKEFIGFAVEGVVRMRRLIEDLLAYSRVGTRGREHVQVDLSATFTAVLRNLEKAIEESSAIITHAPLPVVRGDEVQLAQVLQNIVGNAIKFRRGPAPQIHIGAERQGPEWVISVTDDGIGIAPEYFERIFVIFQRLNPREQYPGTGIGLAITKKIIERHGGRIWVESTPGQGSKISFTLPVNVRAGGRP